MDSSSNGNARLIYRENLLFNAMKMKLRNLELKDAPYMLEWMHDDSVVEKMNTNFRTKTLCDCNQFIIDSKDTSRNLHMAIVDDNDEYMGTVSLKNIEEYRAEFAITVRKCAMGKGYAQFGMNEIIKIGFETLGLDNIYWYVNRENERAIRFYDKCGYQRIQLEQLYERNDEYIWYHISK